MSLLAFRIVGRLGRSDAVNIIGFSGIMGRIIADLMGGSTISLVSAVESSDGLVLFQDNMNVGTSVIISKLAQQVRVHHTSETEVTYGCTSYGRLGPRGHRCRNLVSFSLT